MSDPRDNFEMLICAGGERKGMEADSAHPPRAIVTRSAQATFGGSIEVQRR
jgi:hypothetical protein